MNNLRAAVLLAALCMGICDETKLNAGMALVNHAPTINGTVEGSVQQMSAESVALNSSSVITENLLIPGNPSIVINAKATYAGTQSGTGAETPANFTVTLNRGSSLQHIVTRTDAVAMAVVDAFELPVGYRAVTLNSTSGTVGDFDTLLNLTVNSNIGQIDVPPGRYGKFTANNGSGFTLGVVGASIPSVYEFQDLVLSGGSQLRVHGPVIVRVKNALASSAIIGEADFPSWLELHIYSGGLTLNSGARVYGFVTASSSTGTVTLNGNTQLVGGVSSDRLKVYSGAVLRLIEAPANASPSVTITSPTNNTTYTVPPTLTIQAVALDSDGTVSKVEFYDGETKLGESTVTNSPSSLFEYTAALANAGMHSLTAVATDNSGASTTSQPVNVLVVIDPPSISFNFPAGGSVLPAPAAIELSVTAAATNGHSIAMVEFFERLVKIGEATSPDGHPTSFSFAFTLTDPGVYVFTAQATDSSGLSSVTAVPLTMTVLASLPYSTDFEASEGYVTGSLMGQLGWTVAHGGAGVTSQEASSGAQSLLIDPDSAPTQIEQAFAPSAEPIVFVDFFAKPVAASTITSISTFDVQGARFGFLQATGNAVLNVLDGDGMGGGEWSATGFLTSTNETHQTQNWVRLTSRIDFTRRKWDLYADGNMVAADLGLRENSSGHLASFLVEGDAVATVAIDDLFAGWPHPLFPDANNNGLDDVWEMAHGLSLATNNRESSPTGNGVTVVQAYIGGTDPNDYYNGATPTLAILSGDNQAAPAGQFNALPFVAEVRNSSGTTPLVNAPVSFRVETGDGHLTLTGPGDPDQSSTIHLVTDSNGRISVHYQHGPFALRQSRITVAAGSAQKNFVSTSTAIEVLISGGDSVLWQDSAGNTRLWGQNSLGQLGDGTTESRPQMRRIVGLTGPIIAAALSGGHGLAVTESGLVHAWGDNSFGQVSAENASVVSVATVIPDLTDVIDVAAGDAHSLVLRRDGTVWSWGGNQSGQLGDGAYLTRSIPSQIAGPTNVIKIVAGARHSAALTADGVVWIWGSNEFGQLATSDVEDSPLPTVVAGLSAVSSLVSGRQHLLVRCTDGTIWGWGGNHAGQLGIGDVVGTSIPQPISTTLPILNLDAGNNHSVALCADGTLNIWGANNVGQLGDGTSQFSAVPVALSLGNVKAVAAGWDHVVILHGDGSLQSWGLNHRDQLGTETLTAFSNVPVDVLPPEAGL